MKNSHENNHKKNTVGHSDRNCPELLREIPGKKEGEKIFPQRQGRALEKDTALMEKYSGAQKEAREEDILKIPHPYDEEEAALLGHPSP